MGTRAEHRALCPLVVRALSPTPSNLANHSKLPRICNAFRSLTRRSTARPFLLDWKIRFRGNVFHDHGRKAKYTQRVAGRRVRRHSGSPCTRFRRSRGGDSARSWCDSSLVSRFEQETRVHGTRKFALRRFYCLELVLVVDREKGQPRTGHRFIQKGKGHTQPRTRLDATGKESQRSGGRKRKLFNSP